jgi:hypothetical protein
VKRKHRKVADKAQRIKTRAGRVLTRMREGASLTRASREVGIDPRMVKRLAKAALRQTPSGGYVTRRSDRLPRVVRLPDVYGLRDEVLRNSKDATLVGEYWNAVHAYFVTGDTIRLNRFQGVRITTADGEKVSLLTDQELLDQMASAGVLSFESIYARGV